MSRHDDEQIDDDRGDAGAGPHDGTLRFPNAGDQYREVDDDGREAHDVEGKQEKAAGYRGAEPGPSARKRRKT
ncbi:MAG: hypothetical protein R3C10_11915 [Pirellulales bacterium]